MIREEDVYRIGTITKTHGISGEVSMTITDDVFDRVDADHLICRMDGILVPFFMESYRFKSDTTVLVKFEDIDNEVQARKMAGVEVYFEKALSLGSEDEHYAWSYFVDFEIVDVDKGRIGRVTAVDESTVNVLFEVQTDEGDELLIPASEDLIDDIDHQKRIIYMTLPEGLLSLDEMA